MRKNIEEDVETTEEEEIAGDDFEILDEGRLRCPAGKTLRQRRKGEEHVAIMNKAICSI